MTLVDLAAWRAYFWPGTEVLRNRLDLRDAARLAEAEALYTRARMEQGVPLAPPTPMGFCAIHRHLFQDVYDWAGKYRKANMRHADNGAFFCKVEFIAASMNEVFEQIRTSTRAPLITPDSFAAAIATPVADINAIHPFREGNGRALRIFIAQLAGRSGLRFDQTKIQPARWNACSRESFVTGDTAALQAVLVDALLTDG